MGGGGRGKAMKTQRSREDEKGWEVERMRRVRGRERRGGKERHSDIGLAETYICGGLCLGKAHHGGICKSVATPQ